ncbi:hypothetical protein IWZ01DRAFT_134602 [Phyllosticta capitalensis]
MRPTPRVCRAAAHSIVPRNCQALWITDDALVDALHRYTKASDAAKRSGSKRFGSNVPGPLEARRRLAGRRMGGLSAVGPPSAVLDFGALFGGPFAGANRTPVEKSWRWEPPRPAGQSMIPDESSPPAPTFEIPDLQFVESDSVEQFRLRLRPIKKPSLATKLMEEFRVDPEDRILINQIACDHFIARLASDRRDGHKWLFKFVLENKYSVKKAGLVNRVVQHFAETGFFMVHNLDDFVSNFLPTACRLGKLHQSDLSSILDLLPSICYKSVTSGTTETKGWLLRVYRNIWQALRGSRELSLEGMGRENVAKLAELVASLPDPSPKKSRASGHRTDWSLFRLELYNLAWPINEPLPGTPNLQMAIESWARQLMESDSPNSSNLRGLTWDVLVSLIDSLPSIRAQFAMVAATRRLFDDELDLESSKSLQIWVDCLARVRHCSLPNLPSYRLRVFEMVPLLAARVELLAAAKHFDNMDPVNLARGWLRAWLPLYNEEQVDHARWEVQHVKMKLAFEEGVRRMNPRFGYDDTKMFELIFRLFADLGIVSIEVRKALEFLLEKYGPGEIFRLLQRLRTRNIFLQNPLFLASLIETLAETRPLRALEIFKKTPGMWLSLCPNLPLTLIAHGALKREEFFALVNRWPRVVKEGLSQKEIDIQREELRILRSEMVQFVAFAWADAGILPTRVRFRNVYWCWRYLLDHYLPITPLLSKAFVRAAITGPLQNHQWVSRIKIGWVLEKFVRPLEGEYVERELGRLIHVWRGELIQEARRRWDKADYFRRFGPSTVDMVRRAGLFEDDFPRRTLPASSDDGGVPQRMLVRRQYVRSGRNAADRFPRLWCDRTYTKLPARDRLRWFRTPVLGNSRAHQAGPQGNPMMVRNGPRSEGLKKDMKRWKRRKEARREIRAAKRKVRESSKTPELLAADELEVVKQEKKRLALEREQRSTWSKTMAKSSVWQRARMKRGQRKWRELPLVAKPHRSSVVRKVQVDGLYRIPQALWKSGGSNKTF